MSGCGGCKTCPPKSETKIKDAEYTIALAGNANVGKSVTFNQLTGVDQIIGNWPGKTVERAEGLLQYKGHRIRIIDLPGIYSFSTYSMEELVSRDFIALERRMLSSTSSMLRRWSEISSLPSSSSNSPRRSSYQSTRSTSRRRRGSLSTLRNLPNSWESRSCRPLRSRARASTL